MKFNYLVSVSCLVSGAVSQAPAVKLTDATYEGTTTKVATATSTVTVDKFIGVRFAAKPTRFRAARPPLAGNATVKATKQPPACTDNEDCLFLNIFAPHIDATTTSTRKKPVMIWWHGGALQSGSTSGTDGSILAANEDVIVIASQYRLGVFGFPGNVSGLPGDELNPGFRDQKLALQWIQENIDRFGGDKTKVTIFGESAGAVSVDAQVLSQPFDQPLFHGAILQSGGLHTFNRVALGVGPLVTGLGTGNLPTEAPFLTLANTLNCPLDNTALPCVQSKTFAEVKSGVSRANLLFPPVDDNGLSSTSDSDSARRANRTTKVPVLVGSTFDEGNIFPAAGIASRSFEEWTRVIYPGDGPTAQHHREAVTAAYAVGTSWQITSASDARDLLHSDFHFACTTTYDSNLISSLDTNPIWRYVFNASMPNGRLAGHGSDVAFVFGSPPGGSAAANKELSRKMMRAWADFARDPRTGPGWAAYEKGKKRLANLGGEGARDGITMVGEEVVDSRCAVFDDAYDPNRPRW